MAERRAARAGGLPWLVLVLLALLLTACVKQGTALPPVPTPAPTPAAPVSFPRDAGAHDALTEWWYFTGHLRPTDGSPGEYGFEFVIFQFARVGQPTGYMAHFAVTDVLGQRFSQQVRFVAGALQPGPLDLLVQGWRLRADAGGDELEAQMAPGPGAEAPYGLRLRLEDRKPPVLHQGGYIDYGAAGGSYYYSRTRLAAAGELRLPDGTTTVPVDGQAWMDHQWGNFVSGVGGWDWFSVQLEDNTELMLYVLRSPRGEVSPAFGTWVLADGSTQAIEPGMVTIDALDEWTSPHTGARYPSGWQLDIPSLALSLRVEPKLRDQELYLPGAPEGSEALAYWEGAVSVQSRRDGGPGGVGYVELTGYAAQAR